MRSMMNATLLELMKTTSDILKTFELEKLRPLSKGDIVPVEVSLERMGYFNARDDSTTGLDRKEINHPDLKARFRVHPDVGLPTTTDQDFYRAFQKILLEHLEEGRSLDEPITVSTNRLLNYSGKSKRGKPKTITQDRHNNVMSSSEMIKRWLDRMKEVSFKVTFQTGINQNRTPLTIRGSVFDTILSPGEAFEETGDVAATNYVWLSTWYKQHVTKKYLRPLDLNFHKQLKSPISKVLYPLLETGWYASKGKPFKKRYSHICDLLLLTKHPSASLIKRQFARAQKELSQLSYIKEENLSLSIAKDDAKDFILSWQPGSYYFEQKSQAKTLKSDFLYLTKANKANHKTLKRSQRELLEDIIKTCDDEKSRRGYIKLLLSYPEHNIRVALSETKLASRQGKIKRSKGAYLTDTLKRLSQNPS